ncbi:MAG: glutaredoxin domain-containing protein [Promethearchaeota archaeon]
MDIKLELLNWTIENEDKLKDQQVIIYYFSLTTCPHCKRGVKWLLERDVSFKWLYLDKLPLEMKNSVKNWIQEKYKLKTRMGTPFVIFKNNRGDFISNGYDPSYWASKIQ